MRICWDCEDQPTLVVGGGYGIGRATALMLAQAGARVAVADIIGERARGVADEIGGHAIVADVTAEDGARAIVDEAHDALGGLTRVANIVGGASFRDFETTDLAHWEAEFRFNLVHHVLVCQAAGRHMLAEGGGAIAMVASVSGLWAREPRRLRRRQGRPGLAGPEPLRRVGAPRASG